MLGYKDGVMNDSTKNLESPPLADTFKLAVSSLDFQVILAICPSSPSDLLLDTQIPGKSHVVVVTFGCDFLPPIAVLQLRELLTILYIKVTTITHQTKKNTTGHSVSYIIFFQVFVLSH